MVKLSSVRPLLGKKHQSQADHLEILLDSGDREKLLEEIKKQTRNHSWIPAYSIFVDKPGHFNLTSLRFLLAELRECGQLLAAVEVAQAIAQRSARPSDVNALRILEDQVRKQTAAERVDLPDLESYSAEAATALLVCQDIKVPAKRVQQTVDALNDSGFTVTVGVLGNEDVLRSLQNATVVACHPSSTSAETTRSVASVVRDTRPSLVHLALDARNADAALVVTDQLRIPTLWEVSSRDSGPLGTVESSLPAQEASLRSVQESNLRRANKILIAPEATVPTSILDPELTSKIYRYGPTSRDMGRYTTGVQFVLDARYSTRSAVNNAAKAVKGAISSLDASHAELYLLGPMTSQLDSIVALLEGAASVRPIPSLTELPVAEGRSASQVWVAPGVYPRKSWGIFLDFVRASSTHNAVVVGPPIAAELGHEYLEWSSSGEPLAIQVALEQAVHRSGKQVDRSRGVLSNRKLRTSDIHLIRGLYRQMVEVVSVGEQKKRSTRVEDFSVSLAEADDWTNWIAVNQSENPFEWFDSRSHRSQDVINAGWSYENFDKINIDPTVDWSQLALSNRSWGFHLHAWEFLDPVIQSFRKTGNLLELEWCLDVVSSWVDQMLGAVDERTMAWYDMSLSWRSPRLASLIHLAVRHGYSGERLLPLFRLVRAHMDAHSASESFAAHNNHGFYAALGQLVISRDLSIVPGMDSVHAQGGRRMRIMAESQFFSDGGHAEHSPDYHRMLLGSFEQAVAQKLISDPEVLKRIDLAGYVLGWFILPDSRILQFGDSPGRSLRRSYPVTRNAFTQFVASDGRFGTPDNKEMIHLPETGYAIVRTPAPQRPGDLRTTSYLAMAGGFHSRAHKHCDDLSIVWTHEGREILVDGGRFGYGEQLPKGSPLRQEGYFYADPERQFVESVLAHSTVSIDGKNHDRRRTPYGSGIENVSQSGGLFEITATATHSGWTHRRHVQLQVGEALIIDDEITPSDAGQHSYLVHFNINGELELTEESDGSVVLAHKNDVIASLSWDQGVGETTLVRGQSDPLRGWRSIKDRTLEPTWSLSRSGSFQGVLKLRSVFRLVPA